MPEIAGKVARLGLTCAAIAAAITAGLAGCASPAAHRPVTQATHATRAAAPPPRDPETAAALLQIATVFNNDYDRGVYGPVYDRWDARSKAIISRADYIRRHTECPSVPVTARVENARRGPNGAWLVSYAIDGAQFTDYWFYVDGRWLFDLPLSNPDSVHLYEMPARQYLADLGCSH